MNEHLLLNKFDVAKQQLETAIELYFHEKDPISIHTLAGAARQIIFDINKKQNGLPMTTDLHFKNKEDEKTYLKALKESMLFFKHAKEDTEEIHLFNSGRNDFFLYDACEKYRTLAKEKNPYMEIFEVWFKFKYQEAYNFSNEAKSILKPMEKYREDKKGFFRDYFPLILDKCNSGWVE